MPYLKVACFVATVSTNGVLRYDEEEHRYCDPGELQEMISALMCEGSACYNVYRLSVFPPEVRDKMKQRLQQVMDFIHAVPD